MRTYWLALVAIISPICLTGCHNANSATTASNSESVDSNSDTVNPLTSDNSTDAAVPAAPALDSSTPDRAVESLWALEDYLPTRSDYFSKHKTKLDLQEDQEAEDEYKQQHAFYVQLISSNSLSNFVTDPAVVTPTTTYTYSRDISNVDMQTPSRALVDATIKNTTPVPSDVTLTSDDQSKRSDGEKYEYTLEKESTGWRITEISKYDPILSQWDHPVTPGNTTANQKYSFSYTDTSY